jgi:hypothetical protein
MATDRNKFLLFISQLGPLYQVPWGIVSEIQASRFATNTSVSELDRMAGEGAI